MATKISWTNATWNPTVGCSRVSPGCTACYAVSVAHRAMQPAHKGLTVRSSDTPMGADWTGEVRLLPERLQVPLRRRKPTLWFVDSMSDLFHKDVPEAFIGAVWGTMAHCPQHRFQILTKRPQRMADVLTLASWARHSVEMDVPWPLPNCWLGTSIESDRYTFRANHLRATPAAVRFLSLEPLLGPLPSLDLSRVDWVILGGESGPGARRMDAGWAVDLIAQCREAGVAVFFKQAGSVLARELGLSGKGEAFDELPPELQVREWPEGAS